jgi:hypothetical protein
VEAVFISLGGPKTHDSSGRDDNSVAGVNGRAGSPVLGHHKIVIPTGAKRSGGTCCFQMLKPFKEADLCLPFSLVLPLLE